MQFSCRHCAQTFVIDNYDQAYYAKMQVPPPTLCPSCREQRKLSWRVERNLYMRTCDKSGRKMLSAFPPDHPNPIYHHKIWYENSYDACDYGRDFDFNRSFFDQFKDLLQVVPLFSLNVAGLQNCEYVNQCGWSKNCYMTIDSDSNEDCIHCHRVFFSKSCIDCTETVHSERCYECTDCHHCFQLRHSQICEQCNDSTFLFDCRSCSNCFGCVGLRQKKYCMFNEELNKEEYLHRMEQFDFCRSSHFAMTQEVVNKLKSLHPRKYMIGEQNDNVIGDYIYQSKNCFDCFQIRSARDCRYCNTIYEVNDCMDYICWGAKAERIYECQECGHGAHNLRFCNSCWDGVYSLLYCFQCVTATANCFGCVGMQKGEYCILNKQYSKDEYEKLVERIKEHMQETGEWGEFFPTELSPHAYNETVAHEYFPMQKDDALARGWKWRDELPFTKGNETTIWDKIPFDINDVPETIVDEILACKETGKNFRITKQELLLYKQLHIPIPRLHPDVRHFKRMEKRNPRHLWNRQCEKCGKEIRTTYSPERQEKVLCEKCYLAEVY